MKKIRSTLAILLIAAITSTLLFINSAVAVTYPVTGVISRIDGAAIYDGAGTYTHSRIAGLNYGTQVTVIGEEKDSDGDLWYIIKFGTNNSQTGYVYSGRCSLQTQSEPSEDANGVITASDGAAVYNGAGTKDHTQIGKLNYGDNVYVVGSEIDWEGDKWYKIRYGNGYGYVYSGRCALKTTDVPDGDMKGLIIASNGAAVYNGAGTKDHTQIGKLNYNDTVAIVGSEIDWEGDEWYKIRYGSGYGYVYSGRCKRVPTIVEDDSFNSYLDSQGFPESYKNSLKQLHALYPNWKFKALNTNLDWNTVLNGETSLARSLIPSSWSDSYKSYESGCYDWNTGKFIAYDSGGWVNASRETIAYYMDPRNFLDDVYVFQFLSLSYSSTETKSSVSSILQGTFMGGAYPGGLSDSSSFPTYADAFMSAASGSGVSAYHLASRAVQEQGTPGTQLGLGTVAGYNGYYNIFNYGASGEGKAAILQNGAKYAQNNGWTTPYKSILGASKKIASNYINKGQVNVYLQKFDVVDGGNGYYANQYMQNIAAPSSESMKTKKGYTSSQLYSLPLEFTIPVYNNMPAAACAKPANSGNNNNFLSTLSVSGYSIGTFDRYKYSYELVVDGGVSSINVNAVASDGNAKISGNGQRALNYGANNITVTVTASNGLQKQYTISVYRNGSEPAKVPLKSSKYSVGNYITRVAVGTSVNDFMSGLTSEIGTIKLYNAGGAEKTSGTMATGDVVKVYANGAEQAQYPVVIYGDTNGDGVINTLDLLRGHKHVLGVIKLTDAQLAALDINKDGAYNTLDLLRGQKYILGFISDIQN